MLAEIRSLPAVERPIGEVNGRILAGGVVATTSLPSLDCAAMDGHAVRIGDLQPQEARGAAPEGGAPVYSARVPIGSAHPICTGMPVPAGFEAVVPVERVRPSDGWLEIEGVVRSGDHIRPTGEEIRAGELALPAGARINPAAIGLLAALGLSRVLVCAKPRVGILVTGEELCAVVGPRAPDAVIDSNGPMLAALVDAAGGVVAGRLLVADDPGAIQASVERLADDCDLVLTSGGASVGTRDHLVATIRASGELLVHQLDLKPGRPTSLGRVGTTPIVLLPGNPLAALIGFEALGRPIVRSLAGDPTPLRPRISARAEAPMAHKPGRTECVPVQVTWAGGFATASPLDHRGSGMLRGASLADGIAVLEADRGSVLEGDEVSVEVWV